MLTTPHPSPPPAPSCWGLTGKAAVIWLAAALGAGSRVISLDLLLLAGYDLGFGTPSWVEMG